MAIFIEKMIPVINPKIEKMYYNSTDLLNEYEKNQKTGCLIGQVQSGKTSAIIDIVKNARDNFKYDYIFVLGGTTNMLLEQTINRFNLSGIITKDINNIYNTKNINRTSVYCILKNDSWLKKVKEVVEDYSLDKKILIIDDESDYASINTSSKNKEESTIFKYIKDITSLIKRGGVLFVSATPFSNIKKSTYDINLDFIYSNSYNKDNYTGIEFFSNLKTNIGNFYLDENILDSIKFDNNHEEKNINMEFDRNKLKKVICLWLINSFLLFKQTNRRKSDLLIYLSDGVHDNKSIKIFLKNYQPNTNELDTMIKYLNLDIDRTEFHEFLNKYYFNRKVLLLIRDEKDGDVIEYNKEFNGLRIIVGGVYLSRGFTYENLITEYFTYIGNDICADTLLQRCRWFGYRKEYAKYMNVITTFPIFKSLKACKDLVNILSEPLGCKFNKKTIYEMIEQWEEKNKNTLEATSNAKK